MFTIRLMDQYGAMVDGHQSQWVIIRSEIQTPGLGHVSISMRMRLSDIATWIWGV